MTQLTRIATLEHDFTRGLPEDGNVAAYIANAGQFIVQHLNDGSRPFGATHVRVWAGPTCNQMRLVHTGGPASVSYTEDDSIVLRESTREGLCWRVTLTDPTVEPDTVPPAGTRIEHPDPPVRWLDGMPRGTSIDRVFRVGQERWAVSDGGELMVVFGGSLTACPLSTRTRWELFGAASSKLWVGAPGAPLSTIDRDGTVAAHAEIDWNDGEVRLESPLLATDTQALVVARSETRAALLRARIGARRCDVLAEAERPEGLVLLAMDPARAILAVTVRRASGGTFISSAHGLLEVPLVMGGDVV